MERHLSSPENNEPVVAMVFDQIAEGIFEKFYKRGQLSDEGDVKSIVYSENTDKDLIFLSRHYKKTDDGSEITHLLHVRNPGKFIDLMFSVQAGLLFCINRATAENHIVESAEEFVGYMAKVEANGKI